MLITLEGIDGAGKTTVLEALSDSHPEACTTREPTTSWYGDAVDRSISSPDSDSLAALDAGELVISDRYVDSRIAYQGAALNGEVPRPMEYIRGIHTAFTRMPDATIYYDIDPETGAERAGATNKLEHADFLADVHENYERLIDRDPQRFHRIDATRSPEAVIDATEDVLESLL